MYIRNVLGNTTINIGAFVITKTVLVLGGFLIILIVSYMKAPINYGDLLKPRGLMRGHRGVPEPDAVGEQRKHLGSLVKEFPLRFLSMVT